MIREFREEGLVPSTDLTAQRSSLPAVRSWTGGGTARAGGSERGGLVSGRWVIEGIRSAHVGLCLRRTSLDLKGRQNDVVRYSPLIMLHVLLSSLAGGGAATIPLGDSGVLEWVIYCSVSRPQFLSKPPLAIVDLTDLIPHIRRYSRSSTRVFDVSM